jgi:hypothetical protein
MKRYIQKLLCLMVLAQFIGAPPAEGQRRKHRRTRVETLDQPAVSDADPGSSESPAAAPTPVIPPPTLPEKEKDEKRMPLSTEKVAALQRDVSQVLSEMQSLRSKVALFTKGVFRSQVRVALKNRASSSHTLRVLNLNLDDLALYSAPRAASFRDKVSKLYQGSIAPGFHDLGVEVEQQAKGSADYRYRTVHRFRFEAKRERLTELVIVLEDESDIAENFKEDGEGSYDTQLRLQVLTRPYER